MEGFSNSDAVLTAAMSGGLGRGNGGGQWGGGGMYGRPFADDGSNAARILAGTQMTENLIDCSKDQLTQAIANMNNNFESVSRQGQFTAVIDNAFQSELRTNNKLDVINQRISDNAAASALCCCKLEALIVKENSETRQLMTNTALDAANAKIIQLETINALKGHHGS